MRISAFSNKYINGDIDTPGHKVDLGRASAASNTLSLTIFSSLVIFVPQSGILSHSIHMYISATGISLTFHPNFTSSFLNSLHKGCPSWSSFSRLKALIITLSSYTDSSLRANDIIVLVTNPSCYKNILNYYVFFVFLLSIHCKSTMIPLP